MNANPDSLPDTDGADAEGGELPVKPVRRRRAVKATDEAATVSGPSPSADPGEVELPTGPVEAAPKPRRRKPVAVPTDPVAPSVEDAPTLRPQVRGQQMRFARFGHGPTTVGTGRDRGPSRALAGRRTLRRPGRARAFGTPRGSGVPGMDIVTR